MPKPIRLSKHAYGYTLSRGFSVAEVQEAIRSSPWKAIGSGQYQCHKEFLFQQEWNGKMFSTKQIIPIFWEQDTEILVITVYVQYS